MDIVWKRMIYDGIDYGDYYLVSNTGEIKGVKSGKIRSKNINHEGYYFVSVSFGSRENKKTLKVHRAVAETFLDNVNNDPVINHKDGDKLNNNIDNLEWCNRSYNTIHAYDNELINPKSTKVICLETKEVFDSIRDAALWCGCKVGTISDYLCSRKYRKSAGIHPTTNERLHWMYYKEYIEETN